MRNEICQLLSTLSQPVTETKQKFTVDFAAEEMFICNTLMTIVPVTTLSAPMLHQQWTFSTAKVAQLQSQLHSFLRMSVQ